MPWKNWPVIAQNLSVFQKIVTIQKSLISSIIFVWEFQQALADISARSYTRQQINLVKLSWDFKSLFQTFLVVHCLFLNPLIPKYHDLNSPNLC